MELQKETERLADLVCFFDAFIASYQDHRVILDPEKPVKACAFDPVCFTRMNQMKSQF